MKRQKPKIGYTTRDFSLDPLQWLIGISIRISGAIPLRLHPKSPKHDTQIHGLIIGGGTDLYPALYEIDPKPNYKYDHARDALEIEWLKYAEQQQLPVLGICRGAQLMNVRHGGSLHPDISKVYENAKYPANAIAQIFFRKAITIESGTLLGGIFTAGRIAVNSMHKQSIDRPGDGFRVSAREDNGVVQAIENPAKNFYMGVQFHPEALIYKSTFRKFFCAFIDAARP